MQQRRKVGTAAVRRARMVGADEQRDQKAGSGPSENKMLPGPDENKGEPQEPPATSAARQLARAHEVDLRRIRGTGHEGRITQDDVRKFVERDLPPDAPPRPR